MTLEWTQPSFKFAKADFQRNWIRWLFYSSLFVGGVASLGFLFPNPHPRNTPPNLLIFYPAIFAGSVVWQFISALFLWQVNVTERRIDLGYGKNARYYRWSKIATVWFNSAQEPPSMLLTFKSGKQVEVFLNPAQVTAEKLKEFLATIEVTVND